MTPGPREVTAGLPMALLVGGAAFWERLRQDILDAQDSVLVQTLSFEGDAAGGALADALIASRATDKRVVADSVTKHVINDRLLTTRAARRDPALQREVRATYAMFDRLEEHGIPVRFAWPIGTPRFYRFIVRNHKKLIAIDDRIAYVGGINFSDHNFAWHDFMVRIESPGIAAFLREDFQHTWDGRDQEAAAVIDGQELIIGAGHGNRAMRETVARVIDAARDRIVLQCPYVGEPFWEWLGRARRRGVRVTVIMPEDHNRSIMKWGTLNAARRHGFEFRLLPGPMTHTKALQVDDAMILGSANFDFIGYYHQPEVVFITRQPDLVREVEARILAPDLARSVPVDPATEQRGKQRIAGVGMALSEWLAGFARERSATAPPTGPRD